MRRSTVSLALAILFLATPLVAPAGAQTGSEVEVNLLYYDGRPVTTADTVVLVSGWGACNLGLVRKYIHASNYEVTLNGTLLLEPEGVDELWGPVGPVPNPELFWACLNPETASAASWRYYDLGTLSTGVYTFHTTVWTEQPIHDGGDYDGEYGPDKKYWLVERTVTVVVEE
jgi:hypothetical protein